MSKYIDADKLIAEIERLDKENKELRKNGGSIGQEFLFGIGAGYADVLKIIRSLHQEQTEVDFEKEIIRYQREDKTIDQLAEEYVEGVKKFNDAPTWDLIHTAVCYGYELGLNATKEE